MVVPFPPTKDQSWRWQTSNSDYGNFYLTMPQHGIRGAGSRDEIHAECNRKCEAFARQLKDLQAKLDQLGVGPRSCPTSPRPGSGTPQPKENGCTSRPTSPLARNCTCLEKETLHRDNAFHTMHEIDYNGGRRTELQLLDDRLRTEHPKLVKRPQPKLATGAFTRRSDLYPRESGDMVPVQQILHPLSHQFRMEIPLDKTMVNIHSLNSQHASDANVDRLHRCKMMGMYRRPEAAIDCPGQGQRGGQNDGTCNMKVDRNPGGGSNIGQRKCKPITRGAHAHKRVLPPSQRYNFYRYYGFGGQGAKTSSGWTGI